MINPVKIFIGCCSLYLACGLSYLLYVSWKINNITIGGLIKLIKNPPIHMTILNILFRPLVLARLKIIEILDSCKEEE